MATEAQWTHTLLHICILLTLAAQVPVGVADHNCDSQANENSYLWKVHTQPPVYLFGTVHVPYTKLWEFIPENAKTAFIASQDLCIELRLNDPGTISDLAKCQQLSKSESIEQVLSAETHQRVTRYLTKIKQLLPQWLETSPYAGFFGGGNSAAESSSLFEAISRDWERKRPVWILLMLSSLTEENIRLRKVPLLDVFLDNVAEGLGKRVQAVEEPRDQCKPLNKLNNLQVELALRVQLDYLEPLVFETTGPQGTVDSDVQAYRCGDFEELVSSTGILPLPPLNNITNITAQELAILQDTERFLYGQLVTRRNRKMTDRLNVLLTSPRNTTVFVALGAGHFLGKKSVIDRLRRRDYTIEHISASDIIEGPTLPSNIIALGDPDSVPTLMDLGKGEEDDEGKKERNGIPTLGPEILAEIWEEFVLNAPSWPATLSEEVTTPTPSSSLLQMRSASGILVTSSTESEHLPSSATAHAPSHRLLYVMAVFIVSLCLFTS